MTAIYDYLLALPPEIYSSLFVMVLISVFAIIVGHLAKKAQPNQAPSTLVWLGEEIVGGVSSFIHSIMGKKFSPMTGYFVALVMYLPISFLISLVGFPTPVSIYSVTFSLALVTFFMIHGTAIKYQKWGYFKRFVAPFWPFLPVNILSTFAPLISLSYRLLGNALSGMIILALVYWTTEGLTNLLIGIPGLNLFGPLITPVLHAYFDVFGALIQTLVFVFLTALFVAQEAPSDEK